MRSRLIVDYEGLAAGKQLSELFGFRQASMSLFSNHHATLPVSQSSFLLLWKQDLGTVWKFP